MPLEAIIAAIEEESQKAVQAILSEAEQQVEKILADARKEASEKADLLYEQKVQACRKEINQKIAAARLQARNRLLQSQEEWIQKVFETAREQLQNLEPEQYRQWMQKQIVAHCESESVEILLAARDRKRLGRSWEAEVKKELQEKGVAKQIRFHYVEDEFTGGFILRTARYDVQLTFEALLNQVRKSLQFKIYKVLFEEKPEKDTAPNP